MSWFELLRKALELLRAFQEKTRGVCPNKDCPLKMNRPRFVGTDPGHLTQDEMIRRQEELFRRNHPNEK